MRIFKAIYLSVLFTLAMGLFCGELPESLRLQDDTTNDFVADSSASAARESATPRESESARKQVVGAQRVAAQTAYFERFSSFSVSSVLTEPFSLAGKELLPVLSIRRT